MEAMLTAGDLSYHEPSLPGATGPSYGEGMRTRTIAGAALAALLFSCAQAPAPTPRSPTMPAVNIDLQAHPNLQFRIDAFTVPAASRPDFETAMHRNLAFLETIHGFRGHVVFEKTAGPSAFDVVTIAVWESPEAVAAAGEKVRAYYQSIGFDMPAMLARWGVTAALGFYDAPAAMQ
jgi:heme-degrading monooxygenase HmoA